MECERPSLATHQQQQQQQQEMSAFTRENELSTCRSIASPADSHGKELIATSRGMDIREEVAGTSFANTSSSSLTAVRTANKRNKKQRSSLSHEWMMAMMLLLLCSSSFHQSAVLVGATSNTADEMDSRGADNNRGAKMMTRKNLNNHNNNNINGGIQRKRVGERRAAELGGGKMEQQPQAPSSLSALQFQRITNHRRLDRQHQQGQQQFVNHEQKRQASSSAAAVQATTTTSRTLQEGDNPFDMPTMCTCSPQIFNIKITLTSTSPCSTDDLLPNGGIDNTLCLYTNPVEEGVYPPAPPTAPPTSMEPTSSPVGTSSTTTPTTMKPTDEVTNDPFKPPPPPLTDQPKPGYPTYSPSTGDETYSPTITGMPNTPSPSYSPTNGDERMVPPPDGGGISSSVGGSPQRDASGSSGSGSGEPTYAPTFPWPTFSPTSNPTPYSDENGDDGAKQPRGGWMEDDEDDGMLDDDELIGLHHHRHHHHHQGPPAAGRKRVLQVINVDELNGRGEVKDGTSIDDSGSSSDGKNNSKNKDVQPPYFQPPVVRKSILDAWTSIHPNDVFFNEHPELKSYQEEIYRMKHSLPSLSSSSSSSSLSHNTRSLQDNSAGLMPTRLISAQFLEMDTSPFMNIINQDDQYINVTFPDPTNIVLQFSSISNLLDPALPMADQMEYVPGGAILIFVGATASGEIVRNRMLWTYTMGCGLEDYTVLDGNVIGWAGFEKLTPAREEFCPSSGNLPPPATPAPSAVPTPAPFTKAPTASAEPTTEAPSLETTSKPTKKPSSKKPTSKKPSMSMGSGDIFDHFDLSGKSKKDKKKKKKKRRGMDERDFDRMKEDFRTLRRRETMMEFGRPLQ